MVDPIYKIREDFLMDNPYDEAYKYERKAINKELFNILQRKEKLRDIRGGKKLYRDMRSDYFNGEKIKGNPSRKSRQNYVEDNVMRKEIKRILKGRDEIIEEEPEEDILEKAQEVVPLGGTRIYDPEEGGYFENDKMRKEIRRILEHRIKSGAGYYDSLLNNKYGLKATKYMKKRKARDQLGEYYRRMKGGQVASKKNGWIKFLAKFRKANPQLKGREVMKVAGPIWDKIKKEMKKENRKRK